VGVGQEGDSIGSDLVGRVAVGGDPVRPDDDGVLDPADRRAGLLDPKTLVTGSGEDVPLRDALAQLLNPVKMSFEVRDEVIVLKYKALDR